MAFLASNTSETRWFVGLDQDDALVRPPFSGQEAAFAYRDANPGTKVFRTHWEFTEIPREDS